jgi:chromosome segregation ATPase
LLYEEHFTAESNWQTARAELENKLAHAREAREAEQAKLLQYEQHWDALTADPADDQSAVRARLAESARKIGQLKANEAIMTRKYAALEARERLQRAETAQLRAELVQLENRCLTTVGSLTRDSEAASFKAATLLKASLGQNFIDLYFMTDSQSSLTRKFYSP